MGQLDTALPGAQCAQSMLINTCQLNSCIQCKPWKSGALHAATRCLSGALLNGLDWQLVGYKHLQPRMHSLKQAAFTASQEQRHGRYTRVQCRQRTLAPGRARVWLHTYRHIHCTTSGCNAQADTNQKQGHLGDAYPGPQNCAPPDAARVHAGKMRTRGRASTALQLQHQSAHRKSQCVPRWAILACAACAASGSCALLRTALTSLRRALCSLLTTVARLCSADGQSCAVWVGPRLSRLCQANAVSRTLARHPQLNPTPNHNPVSCTAVSPQ